MVDRAAPGTVVVDERFKAALTHRFAFELLAHRQLKRIAENPGASKQPALRGRCFLLRGLGFCRRPGSSTLETQNVRRAVCRGRRLAPKPVAYADPDAVEARALWPGRPSRRSAPTAADGLS
jgi:hypothetical protein